MSPNRQHFDSLQQANRSAAFFAMFSKAEHNSVRKRTCIPGWPTTSHDKPTFIWSRGDCEKQMLPFLQGCKQLVWSRDWPKRTVTIPSGAARKCFSSQSVFVMVENPSDFGNTTKDRTAHRLNVLCLKLYSMRRRAYEIPILRENGNKKQGGRKMNVSRHVDMFGLLCPPFSLFPSSPVTKFFHYT